jgi:hypothetical protein
MSISRYAKSRNESEPSDQEMIRTVDHSPYRSFGDREFKRARTQCNKNPDFAICEIAIESGPSDQEMIWTVDLISHGVSGIGICK